MSGVGITGNRVQHLLGISVIGSDAKYVTSLFTCIIDSLDSLVGSSNSDDSSIVITSMTHHVGRSKVAHDEFVFASLDNFGNLVCDSLDAHFGLLVISSDLGRGDHVSFLAFELLLDTSIEEEGDVGVFLGLCSCQTRHIKQYCGDLPAMWHCLTPCLPSHSARTLVMDPGGKAMGNGNSPLYRVMVVMCRFSGTSTSMGLSGIPRTEAISLIRSDR
jgi:hypothetical protein